MASGPARKFFPGYIFVKMELNTDTWHLVNGTPEFLDLLAVVRRPGRFVLSPLRR